MDVDPHFCEVTMKRLLHYRQTGKTGGDFLSDASEEVKPLDPQLPLFAPRLAEHLSL
jgi:hypothetical protein